MQSLETILANSIINAHNGLPERVFLLVGRLTPLINVDLLIQDERGTLLIWRDDKIFGTGWHIPGGVIRYREAAADRVRACARTELGVEVRFEQTPLLVAETILDQVERAHLVSLLFRCQLLNEPDEARRAHSDHPQDGQWRWHPHCPPNLLGVQNRYAGLF